MSIALERRCETVSVRIPVEARLSNWIGTGPWGWFISFSVVIMGTASRAFRKPIPVSDSWTEDITLGMTLLFTKIGALWGGGGSSGLMGSLGLSER